MIETQQSINEWQLKHFPTATLEGIKKHIAEEHHEFQTAETNMEALVEAADIVILLYDWAQRNGFDLHAAIDFKMERNRRRDWVIQSDGTGRHVR